MGDEGGDVVVELTKWEDVSLWEGGGDVGVRDSLDGEGQGGSSFDGEVVRGKRREPVVVGEISKGGVRENCEIQANVEAEWEGAGEHVELEGLELRKQADRNGEDVEGLVPFVEGPG